MSEPKDNRNLPLGDGGSQVEDSEPAAKLRPSAWRPILAGLVGGSAGFGYWYFYACNAG